MKRKEKATGTPKKKRKINAERMMIKRVTQSIQRPLGSQRAEGIAFHFINRVRVRSPCPDT